MIQTYVFHIRYWLTSHEIIEIGINDIAYSYVVFNNTRN